MCTTKFIYHEYIYIYIYIYILKIHSKTHIHSFSLEFLIFFNFLILYLKSFFLRKILFFKEINSIKMWCKTQILPIQSQLATLSYYILKNRHNHTQSILILI